MRTAGFRIRCTALVAAAYVLGFAQASEPRPGKDYPSPTRFESAIKAFEAQDQKEPPPSAAVVCIGSSSMRMWHAAIANDLAPLTVIPRGFGGSNMNDALHYADRVVTAYKPRAVVLYEGDNDVAQGVSPTTIRDTFLAFVHKIHQRAPQVRIYFLSIKPSIQRWRLWPEMKEANRAIAEACAKDKRLTYVDVASAMLDSHGQARKDLFLKDNLHMNRAGYILWRDLLKPVLIKRELAFEPQVDAGAAGSNP